MIESTFLPLCLATVAAFVWAGVNWVWIWMHLDTVESPNESAHRELRVAGDALRWRGKSLVPENLFKRFRLSLWAFISVASVFSLVWFYVLVRLS